jgi:uncharacterized protein YlxW (UPF0749 family)
MDRLGRSNNTLRRWAMKKLMAGIVAAMCLIVFNSLSFADEKGVKGEMKEKKEEIKGEMRETKGELKEQKNEIKGEMKDTKRKAKRKKNEIKNELKDKD